MDRFLTAGTGKHPVPLPDCLETITRALEDIQVISRQRVSDVYTARVLNNWRDICDEEAYQLFTARIPFYPGFQSVANLLQHISCKVGPGSDTTLAGFDSPAAFKAELKIDILNIRNCSFATLDKINIEFSPTRTYHELSIANDWEDEYMKLAEEFQQLHCQLVDPSKCADKLNRAKRWWKFW